MSLLADEISKVVSVLVLELFALVAIILEAIITFFKHFFVFLVLVSCKITFAFT